MTYKSQHLKMEQRRKIREFQNKVILNPSRGKNRPYIFSIHNIQIKGHALDSTWQEKEMLM